MNVCRMFLKNWADLSDLRQNCNACHNYYCLEWDDFDKCQKKYHMSYLTKSNTGEV